MDQLPTSSHFLHLSKFSPILLRGWHDWESRRYKTNHLRRHYRLRWLDLKFFFRYLLCPCKTAQPARFGGNFLKICNCSDDVGYIISNYWLANSAESNALGFRFQIPCPARSWPFLSKNADRIYCSAIAAVYPSAASNSFNNARHCHTYWRRPKSLALGHQNSTLQTHFQPSPLTALLPLVPKHCCKNRCISTN